MKRNYPRKIFFWFEAVFLVLCVFLSIFFICKCISMFALQRDIIDYLSRLETELRNMDISIGQAIEELRPAYSLADQVSTSLGIISAGIALFAVFGGLLSFFNIARTKEIEDAMREMGELLENQQELKAARLLQDGRVCVERGRLQYAKSYFENAIEEGPDTTAALTARYELLLLYVDGLGKVISLSDSQKIFDQLISDLDKSKQDKAVRRQLLADSYFTLGCAYGKCAVADDTVDSDKIAKALAYQKKAIQYHWEDVDYHRNLAYTYALMDDAKNCRRELENAMDCADREPLYKVSISHNRLRKLFRPIMGILSQEMRTMLAEMFSEMNT